MLLTAHIKWRGNEEERINELQLLADWVDRKANDSFGVDKDIIIMGDFNIPKIGDNLYNAITSKGLMMPKYLAKLDIGTNLSKQKRYDQIIYQPTFEDIFLTAEEYWTFILTIRELRTCSQLGL